jgi:hypothetical protein
MKLDSKDFIKLLGFIAVTLSMWYDLKTDFAVTKATVELRLNALENPKQPLASVVEQKFAILPEEIKQQDDK